MIYEVTVLCDYFGQQIVNRYNYLSAGTFVGTSGSLALLTAMGLIPAGVAFPDTSLYGIVQNYASSQLKFVQGLAKALYDDPTDFFDNGYATGVVGQSTGTAPMSPTAALGFRTNRTRTDIARGTKRFAGIDETFVDAGGVLSSGAQGAADEIAEALSEVLSYTERGSSATFEPIVVGKQKYTAPSGKPAYRYYSTLADQLEKIAQNIVWQPYGTIRTQTSRQYGHGS